MTVVAVLAVVAALARRGQVAITGDLGSTAVWSCTIDPRLPSSSRCRSVGVRLSCASRLRSNRRSEASRAGSLCPAATQASSAHSGSSWLHDRGQSAVPRLEVGEGLDDPVEVDVGQPEAAHARGVDDPAAAGQLEGDGRRRGVPAAAGHRVDAAGRAAGAGDERVDQRRLADAGVADQHADPVVPGARAARPAVARGG